MRFYFFEAKYLRVIRFRLYNLFSFFQKLVGFQIVFILRHHLFEFFVSDLHFDFEFFINMQRRILVDVISFDRELLNLFDEFLNNVYTFCAGSRVKIQLGTSQPEA